MTCVKNSCFKNSVCILDFLKSYLWLWVRNFPFKILSLSLFLWNCFSIKDERIWEISKNPQETLEMDNKRVWNSPIYLSLLQISRINNSSLDLHLLPCFNSRQHSFASWQFFVLNIMTLDHLPYQISVTNFSL